MKKLIIKCVFALLILPSALAGSLYYLNSSGFFNIQEVEIVLIDPISGQEQFLNPNVEKLEKNLEQYKGQSLWSIKLSEISHILRDSKWIDSLNIKRSWPATLSIMVKPHEVMLLYVGNGGKLIPIIRDGEMLDSVTSQQAPDVVLLEGKSFLDKPELREKAVDVIAQVPSMGSFSKHTISELRHDTKEGFWMTMIKTGVQVKIGDDQVAMKSARVSKVVDYLETHQFDARVIDANLSKKVLVRLRKGP